MALLPNQSFGNVKLSSLISSGSWVVLFFYPLDWTFVCPTEICEFSDQSGEFEKVKCKVIGCSVDRFVNAHTRLRITN